MERQNALTKPNMHIALLANVRANLRTEAHAACRSAAG
jgi:hypothetical protein